MEPQLSGVHHTAIFGYALIGGVGVLTPVLGQIAAAEKVPLEYYAATFVGLALIVSIVKFWTWFEDRQKKEIAKSEARTTAAAAEREDRNKERLERIETRFHEAITEQFKAHNSLDLERHQRLEDLIKAGGQLRRRGEVE